MKWRTGKKIETSNSVTDNKRIHAFPQNNNNIIIPNKQNNSHLNTFQDEFKEIDRLIISNPEDSLNKTTDEKSNTLIYSNNSKYIINKGSKYVNNNKEKVNEKQTNNFLSLNFLTLNCDLQTDQLLRRYLDIVDLHKIINNTNYSENLIYLQITNLLLISRSNSESAKLIVKTFLNSYFINITRDYLVKKNNDLELFKILKSDKRTKFFYFIIELNDFLFKISNYFISFQSKFPTYELEDLIIKLKQTYEQEEPDYIYINKMSAAFEKYKNNLASYSKPETSINLKEALKRGSFQYTNVPIDFRQTPIELSSEELFEQFSKPMEIHREKGSYDSWERYINTLFYLTREDCYRSLRKEIINIFNKQPKEGDRKIRKLSDVYYYQKIYVDCVEAGKMGIILKIEINLKLNRISMLGNKRLLPGSLVILTDEALENISFCLVKKIDEDTKNKDKNKALVSLEFLYPTYEEINKIIYRFKNKTIQMFESKAFYEAYCHIMKRLKNLKVKNLPFTDIIINFEKDDYNKNKIDFVPEYSRGSLKCDGSLFYPSQGLWPPSLEKNLDKSQIDTIKYSLTNKVALIQGPPGTGKTYVGTLLCKILMESTNNPILIVCYTNHALDQFLGHIYKHEKNILRIGGRCKDENLKNMTLASKRDHCFKASLFKNNRSLFNVKKEILNISEEIQKIVNVTNKKKGLSCDQFETYFPLLAEKIFNDFLNMLPKKIRHDDQNRIINVPKIVEPYRNKIIYAWMNLVNLETLFEEISFQLYFDEEDEEQLFYFYDLIENDMDHNQSSKKINDLNNNFIPNCKNNKVQEEGLGEGHVEFIEEYLFEDEEENLDRIHFDQGYEFIDQDRILESNIEVSEIDDLAYKEDFYKFEPNLSTKEYDQFYFDTRLTTAENIWLIGRNMRYRMVLIIKEKIWNSMENFSDKFEHLNQLIKSRKELENKQDLEIIKKHKIVGMTTTGCSKYSAYLDNIKFETVIVEEAAEVVESHMVTLLTKNTKHLIMIGDHLQLRPKIYNFEIEKNFKFDISMFERLINNGYPVTCLSHQRRMRPEFADFVRLIYGKNYYDNYVTFNRDSITGFYVENQVNKNMIFFNHNFPENSNTGLASKENLFEAEFISNWARFLIQQKIDEEKITILTFYVGQVLKIRQYLKGLNIQNIRVSSVDNYQGEENDYILLSLVRSNKENKIGFLNTRNRVCVAFSRAKLGFFVIGNFEFLRTATQVETNKIELTNTINDNHNLLKRKNRKSLWEEIYDLATIKKILVKEMKLSCQKHKNITVIKSPKDFDNVPEGGCKEVCKERMECGHMCEIYCHNYSHDLIKCKKPCEFIHPLCKHKCTKRCFEDCNKCLTSVSRVLGCGHTIRSECHKAIESLECTHMCDKMLPCGHKCKSFCSETCLESKCKEMIVKKLLCGHSAKIPCNLETQLYECRENCESILSQCGHKCQGTCGSCMQGTLHLRCEKKCDKNLICGHICKKGCGDNCLCDEICDNYCSHGRCQDKCMVECTNCIEKCQNGCIHGKCNLLCSKECTIEPCNERCDKLLECGHRCIGLCGEKCPNVCRVCKPDSEVFEVYLGNEADEDALFYELECGHIVEVQGLDRWLDSNESFKRPHCPKCKSPILKSNRYFNSIKYFYEQLNKIKKICLKDINEDYKSKVYIIEIKKKLNEIKKEFNFENGNYAHFQSFFKSLNSLNRKDYDLLISGINLLTLVEKLLKTEEIFQQLKEDYKATQLFKLFNNHYLSLVQRFEKVYFLKKENFDDLALKVDSVYYAILVLKNYEAYENTSFCEYLLENNLKIKDSDILEKFKDHFGSLKSSKIVEIINVMTGMQWYQCPNRHIYAIGECGRPMEEAQCPECGSGIGGVDHNLFLNNRQFNPNGNDTNQI